MKSPVADLGDVGPASAPWRRFTGTNAHGDEPPDGSVRPRCVPRGSRAPRAPTHMKILVTGGAGFIGSHTCDRLLSLGHEVIVLDALTWPVHRNGRPPYLTPGTNFYQGDTRNRDLVTNLLRRVDAVYHFAAYQDHLPDFSRFSDVNVVPTALLYEIIVAERLDLAGSWWPRRSRRWARDSTGARSTVSRRRGCGRKARLRRASGTSRARCAAVRWSCGPRRSASPIRRTPTACPSSPRRWSP